MKLINFLFTKISIERIADATEKVKVNSKINISEVESIDSKALNDEEGLLKVDFSYNLEYTPNIANLAFEGKIMLAGTKKQVTEIQEKWKEKKMSEEFRILLFNLILRKSNIKALGLEDELKLPLHISLPSLKKQKE